MSKDVEPHRKSVLFVAGPQDEMYDAHPAASQWIRAGYDATVVYSQSHNNNFADTLTVVAHNVESRLGLGKPVHVVGVGREGLVAVSAVAAFLSDPVTAHTVCTDLDLTHLSQGEKTPQLEIDGKRHVKTLLDKGDLPVSPNRILNIVDGSNSTIQQLPGASVHRLIPGTWGDPIASGLKDQEAQVLVPMTLRNQSESIRLESVRSESARQQTHRSRIMPASL